MNPVITIDHGWQLEGDNVPRDRLLASIVVDGCLVHLEAVRVEERGDDGIRHASQEDLDEFLEAATVINGDGNFSTATITVEGTPGEYVILATSYAD